MSINIPSCVCCISMCCCRDGWNVFNNTSIAFYEREPLPAWEGLGPPRPFPCTLQFLAMWPLFSQLKHSTCEILQFLVRWPCCPQLKHIRLATLGRHIMKQSVATFAVLLPLLPSDDLHHGSFVNG